MEYSRSVSVNCAVLVQPCHVVDLIYLRTEKTAWVRQDCSPGRKAQLYGLLVNAYITCIRTHQCAVWCFLTGSVWGSCTCLVRLACSLHGWCHSPFSCSHPERWPILSSKPRNTVITVLIHLTPLRYYEHMRLISISVCGKYFKNFFHDLHLFFHILLKHFAQNVKFLL